MVRKDRDVSFAGGIYNLDIYSQDDCRGCETLFEF